MLPARWMELFRADDGQTGSNCCKQATEVCTLRKGLSMIRTSPKLLLRSFPGLNPQRLPKGRAVSIGIAFRCSDGIVVCADTQITWQRHKDYERKVYHLSGIDWTMASVYAGNPHLMKSFFVKFVELVNARPYGNAATIKEMSEIVGTALCFFDELDTDSTALNLLIGFVVPSKEIGLFRTEGKVISSVLSSFDYVGYGDSSVVRYLSRIMADKQEWLNINQALRVGTYWVLQAKRYIEDCGGDTDAFVLGWDGRMQTRSTMTYNWEQHFLGLENDLSKVIKTLGKESAKDDEFEQRLATLCSHLRDQRRLFSF
jgi:hypothetical protein